MFNQGLTEETFKVKARMKVKKKKDQKTDILKEEIEEEGPIVIAMMILRGLKEAEVEKDKHQQEKRFKIIKDEKIVHMIL